MAVMENRSTFSQRIARIEQGRGVSPVFAPSLASSLAQAPQIKHRRSAEREHMLRGRARGAVYLFAGFCAGLLVMSLLADPTHLVVLADL